MPEQPDPAPVTDASVVALTAAMHQLAAVLLRLEQAINRVAGRL